MGLRQSLTRTSALLLSIAQTRLKLFSLEFEEQKGQALVTLVLAAAALVCTILALLVVSLALVLVFWPTEHRTLALILLALAYVMLAGGLLWLLRRRLADAPPAFAASLQALKEDEALLRRLAAGDGADDEAMP